MFVDLLWRASEHRVRRHAVPLEWKFAYVEDIAQGFVMSNQANVNIYFSDHFNVSEALLEEYGAFNSTVVVDLPLFVDPFLLFHSKNPRYQEEHRRIISYLEYLRALASHGQLDKGRLKALFCFPEVDQNWLGFSKTGNKGRGLGMDFASSLSRGLGDLFADSEQQHITESAHLEKISLIQEGVGKDAISDFTTNLIKRMLCEYTETFAKKNLTPQQCDTFAVSKVDFNYDLGAWISARFFLPKLRDDYVLLTPKDILTKEETWINKEDFFREYHDIPSAITNGALRAQMESYFRSVLPKEPTPRDEKQAMRKTALKFPELYDYFIKRKEMHGDEATKRSIELVEDSITQYIHGFGELIRLLTSDTQFYTSPITSKDAALEKALFLKDVIENKGGYRIFYLKGVPIEREEDLQILYRLVWHNPAFDVSREVNDGRGPADFKISLGAKDKTIVEMKLASNKQLERNLERQAELYQAASDAKAAIKVILFFTDAQKRRLDAVLTRLNLVNCKEVVTIDARDDNKPSASKA